MCDRGSNAAKHRSGSNTSPSLTPSRLSHFSTASRRSSFISHAGGAYPNSTMRACGLSGHRRLGHRPPNDGRVVHRDGPEVLHRVSVHVSRARQRPGAVARVRGAMPAVLTSVVAVIAIAEGKPHLGSDLVSQARVRVDQRHVAEVQDGQGE
ncbi:hypothetical protein PG996_006177 [Apiospora saccharicola]|uniref:Uncharacterized protein n=1 Tax=Apiospora saccharicola TaxID=335842 RepID=A0ABR1VSF3_9PEZI